MISLKILKNKNIIVYIALLLLVYLSYYKLFGIFYQQDEWVSLGWSLFIQKPTDIFQGLNIWQILIGKGRFVPFALGFIFFRYFPFNTTPFAVFSLLFHSANTILTYLLAKKLIKNKLFAFLAAAIFTVNSVSSSAVAWYGTTLGTLPSVTFVLLSLLTFLKFLKTDRKKYAIYTFIYLYISLFFKEIGMQLFFLYPAFAFFYKKQKILSFVKKYWLFGLFFLVSVAYRVYDIRFAPQNQINTFLTGTTYFWQTMAMRLIMYPLTSFSLVLVHPTPFLELSRFFARLYYPHISPQEFSLIAQTNVSDLLSTIFSFILFGMIFALYNKLIKKDKKQVFFWILFILTSYIPYAIITKNFTYLESRYYYLAAPATGILIAFLFSKVGEIYKKNYVKPILIFIMTVFCFWHFYYLNKDLTDQVKVSTERVNFLNQIKNVKPNLKPGNNIFYITSNANYYVEGNKVPFQQGTGYTLMLWYANDPNLPRNLFEKEFLYKLNTQGFVQEDGKGFGYYSDMETLNADIKAKKFDKEDVVFLEYDSTSKILSPLKDK